MSEDEAFIRAIVDGPGDDLPRLVYADWLDDRSDPRGSYLRAELEWVTEATQAALKKAQKLAKPLDAVWVARVSRPPLGVCCDHLALSSDGRPATPDELDAAGDELMVALPDQVRALLLNYKLGSLRGSFVLPAAPNRVRIDISEFVCVEDRDYNDETISTELVDRTAWERDEFALEHEFVFLASSYGDVNFIVSCRDRDRGTVHLMDGHVMPPKPEDRVAASVGEFLSIMLPQPWPLTDEEQAPKGL